jgi:hypothetical protein
MTTDNEKRALEAAEKSTAVVDPGAARRAAGTVGSISKGIISGLIKGLIAVVVLVIIRLLLGS